MTHEIYFDYTLMLTLSVGIWYQGPTKGYGKGWNDSPVNHEVMKKEIIASSYLCQNHKKKELQIKTE